MNELSLALVATSFGFGFRHGIDWDHIAAIGDISASARDRRTAFELSTRYAVAHGLVVLGLGSALVLAGFTIGDGLDGWFGRIAGASLLLLGAWVLLDVVQRGDDYRLRSRTMMVAARLPQPGARADGRQLLVADDPFGIYGARAATGMGVIHGLGVETPTQIAVFVATTQAAGRAQGMALLATWVLGLLVANTVLALVAANGVQRLGSLRRFHVVAGVVVGAVSVAVGALMLTGADRLLPALT